MSVYYYQGNEKVGPITSEELMDLVQRGVITPETMLESNGRTFQASRIKSIVFPVPETDTVVEAPADVWIVDRNVDAYIPPEVIQAPAPQPSYDKKRASNKFRARCFWTRFLGGIFHLIGIIAFVFALKWFFFPDYYSQREAYRIAGTISFGVAAVFFIVANIFLWFAWFGYFSIAREEPDQLPKPKPYTSKPRGFSFADNETKSL